MILIILIMNRWRAVNDGPKARPWHTVRLGSARPAPFQTPDDALVLLSCPFLRQRSLADPQQPTAQSLPDTFLLFINIPIEHQANLWLANMCTWSRTNTPYLGNARRIKNKKGGKKDTKAFSTYKSWIFF